MLMEVRCKTHDAGTVRTENNLVKETSEIMNVTVVMEKKAQSKRYDKILKFVELELSELAMNESPSIRDSVLGRYLSLLPIVMRLSVSSKEVP